MLSSIHITVRPYWNVAEVTMTSVTHRDHDAAPEQDVQKFAVHDTVGEYDLQDPVECLSMITDAVMRGNTHPVP